MRELCYVAQAIGSCTMAVLILTIDILFGGLCLYIVAMYKELQRLVGCIDQKQKIGNSDKAHEQRHRLRDSIEFYLAIIR